uniref:NKAP domain containing 1 n=1 Tax=Jaculus jaculus TaxID=51337 RepID=A0A8C5KXQ3_JACJA
MSRVPLGKVLLRNVIRHTDAHNKIQEESDMWKIRELEKQMEDAYHGTKRKMLPSSSRWGHSGYKELYPEEFETDSSDQQDITNGKKTSLQVKSSTHESRKHKKSKKSHKKKQKKRSHKKQKKNKKEVTDVTADSSSEFSEETGESSTRKRKQPHKSKKKSRKKPPRKSAFFLGTKSDISQSDDSASSSSEEIEERHTKKTKRKKREKIAHVPVANAEAQERTNRRTNWKVATDERSAESSEED